MAEKQCSHANNDRLVCLYTCRGPDPGGFRAVAVVHLECVCVQGGGGFAVCRGLFRATVRGGVDIKTVLICKWRSVSMIIQVQRSRPGGFRAVVVLTAV